ncbi:iron-containing alcohol dehydrogenase [Veronia pacifica]|uniref:Alcohol dehydrogenase n=1 Tax=Veronia pacifica TaxID=1080227 RepID=A0A1C3EFZ6_9GAMM|nr:iron-containing alcohol dehydrogenase [Veronia pacifica]ODA32167.1 alcohol dehydrogenase [Veronia pacifica]
MLNTISLLICRCFMTLLAVMSTIVPLPRPTLFTGPNSSAQLCHTLSLMGQTRILLVTDKPLVELGLAGRIKAELENEGVSCVIFDGVLPDPTSEQVEKGLACYHSEKCTGVLALGGGSPIDCAKVIAAAVNNKKSVRKMSGYFRLFKAPAPFFVIPTTAGTGSEATIAAIVSDPVTHVKTPIIDPKLVPIMAALDPTLVTGLPPMVTAATGMDALTHAVEAYVSRNRAQDSDGYAIAAIKLLSTNLEQAVRSGEDEKVRFNTMFASYLAGMAFTKAGVGYVHAIAHNLGAKYGTPHGIANAIVLPNVLDEFKHDIQPRLAELADAAGVSSEHQSESENAQAFIDYVRHLQATFSIPTTVDDLKSNDIPMLASAALKEAHWTYPVPVYMNQLQCEKLIARLVTKEV